MKNEPTFTAFNQATEPGRLMRLTKVWTQVIGRAAYYGNDRLPEKVAGLHDHKGMLTVRWKEASTAGEQVFFNEAWGDPAIGDGSALVEHEEC